MSKPQKAHFQVIFWDFLTPLVQQDILSKTVFDQFCYFMTNFMQNIKKKTDESILTDKRRNSQIHTTFPLLICVSVQHVQGHHNGHQNHCNWQLPYDISKTLG